MSAFPKSLPPVAAAPLLSLPVAADQLPPDASYRPLPTEPLATIRWEHEATKQQVMQRQLDTKRNRNSVHSPWQPGAGGGTWILARQRFERFYSLTVLTA